MRDARQDRSVKPFAFCIRSHAHVPPPQQEEEGRQAIGYCMHTIAL